MRFDCKVNAICVHPDCKVSAFCMRSACTLQAFRCNAEGREFSTKTPYFIVPELVIIPGNLLAEFRVFFGIKN